MTLSCNKQIATRVTLMCYLVARPHSKIALIKCSEDAFGF